MYVIQHTAGGHLHSRWNWTRYLRGGLFNLKLASTVCCSRRMLRREAIMARLGGRIRWRLRWGGGAINAPFAIMIKTNLSNNVTGFHRSHGFAFNSQGFASALKFMNFWQSFQLFCKVSQYDDLRLGVTVSLQQMCECPQFLTRTSESESRTPGPCPAPDTELQCDGVANTTWISWFPSRKALQGFSRLRGVSQFKFRKFSRVQNTAKVMLFCKIQVLQCSGKFADVEQGHGQVTAQRPWLMLSLGSGLDTRPGSGNGPGPGSGWCTLGVQLSNSVPGAVKAYSSKNDFWSFNIIRRGRSENVSRTANSVIQCHHTGQKIPAYWIRPRHFFRTRCPSKPRRQDLFDPRPHDLVWTARREPSFRPNPRFREDPALFKHLISSSIKHLQQGSQLHGICRHPLNRLTWETLSRREIGCVRILQAAYRPL